MFDFHSHFESPDALFCTASPSLKAQSAVALRVFQGLLPEFWSLENECELLSELQASEYAIGEVGLDRRFCDRVSIKDQVSFLTRVLQFAKETERPVQLHCVKQTGAMVEILRKMGLPKGLVAWHGFNGSLETALEIERIGVLISVRPQDFCRINEYKAIKSNLFLESDYTGNDCDEYMMILQKHYENSAKILNTTPEKLEEYCRERGKAFAFGQTSWN